MSMPDKLHVPVDQYWKLKELLQWLEATPAWFDLPDSVGERVSNLEFDVLESSREWAELPEGVRDLLCSIELRDGSLYAIPDHVDPFAEPIPLFCVPTPSQGVINAEDC